MANVDWQRVDESLPIGQYDDVNVGQNIFPSGATLFGNTVTHAFDLIKGALFNKEDGKLKVECYSTSGLNGLLLGLRCDASGNGYWAGSYNNITSGWQIFKRVAGVNTRLGGALNLGFGAANTKRFLTFEVNGTDLTVDWFDESEVLLGSNSISNGDISGPGFGGFGVFDFLSKGIGAQTIVGPITEIAV